MEIFKKLPQFPNEFEHFLKVGLACLKEYVFVGFVGCFL